MVDYFTKACFEIYVTPAEAALLAEAAELCETCCDGFECIEDERTCYEQRSAAFQAAFPMTDVQAPFAAFRAIFDDPVYPNRPADFTFGEAFSDGSVHVNIDGDNVEAHSLACMLRVLCPSALPLCFSWANTASRACYGAYGGGNIEVRADRIVELVHRNEDIDQRHLVIAMADPEEGLLFWNSEDGFGDLASASVFTEQEAKDCNLPIANAQPEWMELPPRAAYAEILR